jgi:hypothetical protein
MTDRSFEQRLAAAIATLADQAPTMMDPLTMTRLAARSPTGSRSTLWRFDWPDRGLAFLLLVVALLATLVTGALVAGGGILRRDPVVVEPRDPVSVIAHYGKIHEGYVFVYSDGRVVWHNDYSLFENRLSPAGLELVRSGAVPSNRILGLPSSVWAEAGWNPYKPSMYAICYHDDEGPVDATDVVDRLPAAAQSVLRGKERTYPETDAGLGKAPLVPCSEVASEDAHVLVDLLVAAGFEAGSNGPERDFLDAGSTGGFVFAPDWSGRASHVGVADLQFLPILPHGTWVAWGG